MARPKHILVIRFSAMGDVAMTVPVIRALIDQNPDLKITVLTRGFLSPIFDSLPGVKVFAADLKEKHKGIRGLYSLSRELRKLNIDGIADLHNVLRTKVLRLFLSGIPFYQIDKGRADKKALTTGKIFEQLKTTHQRYAEVFQSMGYVVNLQNPIFPKKSDIDLIKFIGETNGKSLIIGIAPFAAHSGKMYPLSLMEEVITDLSSMYQIILFGGGKIEEQALSRIEKQHNNVYSVAGKLTLNEELDLISNLDLMISMDSGNGHLAALFGIQVLSIWGVTHPYAGFSPFNQPRENSLLADRAKYPQIPTSVYGNKYPEGYEDAAGSIPSEMIVKKAEDLLSINIKHHQNQPQQ